MFRAIFSLPGSYRVALASFVGRTPTSIFDVALVLFVAERSSLAVAGVAVGLSSGVGALAAPLQGRLLDRMGRPVLLICTLVHLLLIAALLLSFTPAALIFFSLLSGVARPPISSVVRAGWSRLAWPQDVSLEANRFETLTSQAVTVVGPLVCAAALAWGSPLVALLLAAAGVTLGGLLLCTSVKLFPLQEGAHPESPVRSRPFAYLLLVTGVAGMAAGALQVGLPALALQEGLDAWAPLWYGSQAAGGVLFSLFLARFAFWHRPLWALLVVYALCLGTALALSFSSLSLMAGLLVAGVAAGACLVASYQAAQRIVPLSVLTEAFAAKGASSYVGVGLGAALLGVAAGYQAWWAIAAAPLLVLSSALLAAALKVDWRV